MLNSIISAHELALQKKMDMGIKSAYCLVIISILVSETEGTSKCYKGDGMHYKMCDHGCCFEGTSNPCCLSPYLIASIVLACVVAACLIGVVIFFVVKRKLRGRQSVNPARASAISSNLFRFHYPTLPPQDKYKHSSDLKVHGFESWHQAFGAEFDSRRMSLYDSSVAPSRAASRRQSLASLASPQRQIRTSGLQPDTYTVNRWSARRSSVSWSLRRPSTSGLTTRRPSIIGAVQSATRRFSVPGILKNATT